MYLPFLQADVETVKVAKDDGDISVEVSVEMPFDIKTIECPTHKIKIKASLYNCNYYDYVIL